MWEGWYYGGQVYSCNTEAGFSVTVRTIIWAIVDRSCNENRLLACRLCHESEHGRCELTRVVYSSRQAGRTICALLANNLPARWLVNEELQRMWSWPNLRSNLSICVKQLRKPAETYSSRQPVSKLRLQRSTSWIWSRSAIHLTVMFSAHGPSQTLTIGRFTRDRFWWFWNIKVCVKWQSFLIKA